MNPATIDPPHLAAHPHTPQRGYLALLDAIQQVHRRRALYDALATLPTRTRSIVELRYGIPNRDPLTIDDTARWLGISRRAVQLATTDALRRLRPLIDPHLEDMAA